VLLDEPGWSYQDEPARSFSGVLKGNVVYWARGMVVPCCTRGCRPFDLLVQDCEKLGIEVRMDSAAIDLVRILAGRFVGVKVCDEKGITDITAKAVVLACGGFEAERALARPEYRPDLRQAKVRGTPHNQGDGLRMALAHGALPWGHGVVAMRRRSAPIGVTSPHANLPKE